ITMQRHAATPAMAAPSLGLQVSTPSRKTPSSAPIGIEPIVSPASSTDFECRAQMAIVNSTPPHATVARRAILSAALSVTDLARAKSRSEEHTSELQSLTNL